jgi:hydroxymethylbilane synthase
MTRVRIATRGSDLALAQAGSLAARIARELSVETELVVIKTSGDKLQNISLAKVGGKGLFVKEIEEALLEGRADLAVHSAKDLPAVVAPGLALVAFPEREDPRDALVTRQPGGSVADLPKGSRVGTGSARRTAQLLAARPDLEIVPLRGNVPTRIRKLEEQDLAAVILACAGLERLGLAHHIAERIAPELLLPAVCQGTLALEAREGDSLAADLAALDDSSAAVSVRAERSFLVRLEGDCNVPLAAFAEPLEGGRIRLRGLVSSTDGRQLARGELGAEASRAEAAGHELAEAVLRDGGAAILEVLRQESAS